MSNPFDFKIHKLREANNLLLGQFATFIDTSVPFLSKIERSERILNKDNLLLQAEILKTDDNNITKFGFSNLIYILIAGDPLASETIKELTNKLKRSK